MGVSRALARVPGTQTCPYKPIKGEGICRLPRILILTKAAQTPARPT